MAMHKWMLTAVFLAVLVCVCVRYTGATAAVPHPSTAVELPGERFIRVANDPTAKSSDRAAAVFSLFKEYVKPGDGLRQVRRVLRDPAWVGEAKLCYFALLGGWIPVDMNGEDRTYSLHLFADSEGHSEWLIYYQLAGKSDWGQWQEDGFAFLRGKAGSKGESWIKEFALCYPDGRIEVFKQK
jgi:hypothetical protein